MNKESNNNVEKVRNALDAISASIGSYIELREKLNPSSRNKLDVDFAKFTANLSVSFNKFSNLNNVPKLNRNSQYHL